MPQRSASYEVRATFRAPRAFVYRWCTDFAPEDPKLEGVAYRRKILARSSRRAVYEDLAEGPEGWRWSRYEVTLSPPDRWHAVAEGNYRRITVDYRLTSLPDGGTLLVLRCRRTPMGLGVENPTKAVFEAETTKAWERFARALERDYRRSSPKRTAQ